MLKRLFVTILLLTLSACEHTHSWAQRFAFMHSPKQGAEQFDFNWQLSGAREVAPLQVFSTADRIWLQFALDQNIPAIFAIKNEQHIPLRYQRSEPYVVIDGAWQDLVFRGAALKARAQYQALSLVDTLETPLTAETIKTADLVPTPAELVSTAQAIEPVLATEPQSFPLNSSSYRVSPADGTMRQALKRWAQQDGWVFLDQHWEVDMDLPIVSSAGFSADFTEAITQLVHSTAMGARPLQVCLYSNKVMRVIPSAQNCDPTTTASYQPQG